MPVDRAAAVAAARLDPATPKHWLLIVVLEALSGCTVNWLSGCQSGSRLPARSSIDDDITTCSPSRPFYSGSGREVEDSDFACGVDICRWRRTALVSSALAFALAGMTVARLSLDIILALRGQSATIFRHDPRLSTIWTWSSTARPIHSVTNFWLGSACWLGTACSARTFHLWLSPSVCCDLYTSIYVTPYTHYGAHVCARCTLIDCRGGILSRKGRLFVDLSSR